MSNGWLSLSSLYTTYIAVSRTWSSAESSVNVWLHACMLPKQKSNWFSCLRCPRTDCILGHFINDSCGGLHDEDTQGKPPRNSVMSAKRQKLVAEHNSNRTRQHVLLPPLHADDAVKCSLCGAVDREGWRRFSRFTKMTCPMASWQSYIMPYDHIQSQGSSLTNLWALVRPANPVCFLGPLSCWSCFRVWFAPCNLSHGMRYG